jgi:hypothetical protein
LESFKIDSRIRNAGVTLNTGDSNGDHGRESGKRHHIMKTERDKVDEGGR